MLNRMQRLGFGWAVLAMFMVTPGSAADAPLIDQLRTAWQKQQAGVHSFVVEWDEQRTIPKGMAGGTDKQGVRLPLEDTTNTIRYRMVGSRNRVRLERSGIDFDSDLGAFIDKQFVRTFDTDERREIFRDDRQGGGRSAGFIHNGHFFDDGSYLTIQPVTYSFRPLSTELGGIDLATYTLTEQRGSVNGIACHVLERPHGPRGVDRLWLAQETGFRVLRRQLGIAGRPAEELTIGYKQHPGTGWVCSEWTYLMRSQGDVPFQTCTAKVTDLRINEPVDESAFRYQFPRGTIVNYEGTNNYAIARADGSLRAVTAGERAAGISNETLLKTAPLPEAIVPPQRRSYTFIVLVALGGIGLISWVGRLVLRRRSE